MTVENTTSIVQYDGDGVATVFPVPFRFFENTDLDVVRVTALDVVVPLTLGTDYTVSGAGEINGGSITTSLAAATGEQIVIARLLPLTQETDLRNQGNFFPEIHEDVFDRLTMLIQQLSAVTGRALTRPRDGVNWDAQNRRINNLGSAQRPTDAANLGDVTGAVSSAITGEALARAEGDANLQKQIGGQIPLESSRFSPISWHDQDIGNSVNIPSYKNAWTFGPQITIDEGQVITIGEGSFWTVAEGDEQQGGINLSDYAKRIDLSANSDASKGANLIGYAKQYAASAVRTVQEKLQDNVSIMDFAGVIPGADSTSGIQAAFTQLGQVASTNRRTLQRSIDLCGQTFLVSSPLSLAGCDGLIIRNGSLVASAAFPSNRAILEHTVANTELWGLCLDKVTLQCAQLANGINIQRHQAFRFINSIILGWGQREYGIQLGPVNYSADACIINPRISGFSVSYSDNPVSTRTGTGIISETADTMIIGGNIDTGKKCLKITSSTSVYLSHIWNGNPGNEGAAEANNIGIDIYNDAACLFVGNTFDNCCHFMNGQVLFKSFVGNKFYSNQQQLDTGLIFKASAAGQAIADFMFTQNQFHGFYKRPITLDITSGTYTALGRTTVKDNPLRSFASGANGYGDSMAATVGTIVAYVGTSQFNASGVIRINLGKHLLLPSYADVLGINTTITYDSRQATDSANSVNWTRYDPATGLLSIKCTAAFNGRIRVDFDQSYMSLLITPEAAS